MNIFASKGVSYGDLAHFFSFLGSLSNPSLDAVSLSGRQSGSGAKVMIAIKDENIIKLLETFAPTMWEEIVGKDLIGILKKDDPFGIRGGGGDPTTVTPASKSSSSSGANTSSGLLNQSVSPTSNTSASGPISNSTASSVSKTSSKNGPTSSSGLTSSVSGRLSSTTLGLIMIGGGALCCLIVAVGVVSYVMFGGGGEVADEGYDEDAEGDEIDE